MQTSSERCSSSPELSPGTIARAPGSTLMQMYRRHGDAVRARCWQILRHPASAEDAMQETFLRAGRALFRLTLPEDAAAWLYTIATNVCLDEVRDRRRRNVTVESLPDQEAPAGRPDQVVNRDLAMRILARVPGKVSVAAWYCHVDEMTRDEAAAVLGVTRRTVVNRLARFGRETRRFLSRLP